MRQQIGPQKPNPTCRSPPTPAQQTQHKPTPTSAPPPPRAGSRDRSVAIWRVPEYSARRTAAIGASLSRTHHEHKVRDVRFSHGSSVRHRDRPGRPHVAPLPRVQARISRRAPLASLPPTRGFLSLATGALFSHEPRTPCLSHLNPPTTKTPPPQRVGSASSDGTFNLWDPNDLRLVRTHKLADRPCFTQRMDSVRLAGGGQPRGTGLFSIILREPCSCPCTFCCCSAGARARYLSVSPAGCKAHARTPHNSLPPPPLSPPPSPPPPPHQNVVCLAMEKHVAAIGSNTHLAILDTRSSAPGFEREVGEDFGKAWGIRSLSFRDHLLTVGGGSGRIYFVDLRTNRFLPLDSERGKLLDAADRERRRRQAEAAGDDGDDDTFDYDFEDEYDEVYGGAAARGGAAPGGGLSADAERARGKLFLQTGVGFIQTNDNIYQAREALPRWKGKEEKGDSARALACRSLRCGVAGALLRAGLDTFCHGRLHAPPLPAQDYYSDVPIRQLHHACYAHEWDAEGARLATGGGPLPSGLKGIYGGVWSS